MTRSDYQFGLIFGLCTLLLVFFVPAKATWGEAASPQSFPVNAPMASPSRGVFLVASPKILDPNFNKTVILLLEHGAEGSVGLIINRPTKLPLSSILPEVDAKRPVSGHLYDGGPVDRKTLTLLYRSEQSPSKTLPLFGDVYASQSARILAEQLGVSEGEKGFRLYAGYAGWGAGQLLREVEHGDWQLVKADVASLYYGRSSKGIWQEMLNWSQSLRVRSNPIKSPASTLQSG